MYLRLQTNTLRFAFHVSLCTGHIRQSDHIDHGRSAYSQLYYSADFDHTLSRRRLEDHDSSLPSFKLDTRLVVINLGGVSGDRENHESTGRYFNVCMYTAVARTCDEISISSAMQKVG